MTDIVNLTEGRYKELCEAEMMLDALRVYGVYNWIGYQASVDLFNKWVSEEMVEDL